MIDGIVYIAIMLCGIIIMTLSSIAIIKEGIDIYDCDDEATVCNMKKDKK